MILSDKRGVQQIVVTLAGLGLREVVVCPGSRDAPLIISFNRHPDFHCTSIRDERSAAFFALGKSIESGQPVALVCTSGSAALNFSPGIVEAYYQRIPLIVLTADRPKEWTDQGDGQTINQTDIFRNFIRKSYELKGEANTQTDIWFNNRCLSEGYNMAVSSNKGPVHFNIPLHEPLYKTAEFRDEISQRVFVEEVPEKRLSKQQLADLITSFLQAEKVMILAGQHPKSKALEEELIKMAALDNVVVLTESTSNLHHPLFVENIDRCITGMEQEQAKELLPELLITIGGAVVSKRIKKILREHRPKLHWNIHPFEATMDTYQSLTNAIPMEPVPFFHQFRNHLSGVPSGYRQKWQQLKKEKERRHNAFCDITGYSDFKVFQKIYACLPADIHLHVANSSPVRYAQLFDNSKVTDTWCNRGTSGIDGCGSTAVGAATASPEKDFLFITGDVAFQYDNNALWGNPEVQNLKIIVLNNGGGGIFRIIEGPNNVQERKEFLETAMDSDVRKLAAHYHWNYLAVDKEAKLEEILITFFSKETRRTILEIFTNPEKNPVVLEKYWKFLNNKK